MHFNRLRLTGFKSFVDPTDLVIEPGLTGIVGPNGCGKSNLVEALRWAMGETSAKRMRGGEMDDVIFGGTTGRSARNIAEVSLHLDNRDRTAPVQFNEEEELEVVRRIERQQGSHYRVNGREVRARDVQLLFADAATGASSTALVSQGRIGAIINAKPVERRGLLEEAAGIGGLHSRRHEAELRLKAAEANLSRLDDVIVTLQAQYEALKKQAKQAGRYRRLAEHIRRAEAVLLHLEWQHATEAVEQASARLEAAQARVAELTQNAAHAGAAKDEAGEALPPLRQEEAAAAAELQRLTIAHEQLEAEERRVRAAQRDAEQRLAQLDQDRRREEELAADAAVALKRLVEQRAATEAAQQGEAALQQEAAERLAAAKEGVAVLEGELSRLTEEVAAIEARRGALARQQSEAEERRARLAARLDETARQRAALEAQAVSEAALAEAAAAVTASERESEQARQAAEAAEEALRQAQGVESGARERAHAVEARRATLATEKKTITELLAAGAGKVKSPVLDEVEAEPGFEAALGAALGEDLGAPLDTAEPRHWAALPPYDYPPALPAGIASLADHVRAPEALARRLSQIGLVADNGEGERLRSGLLPGQRLVTREGALWRWDGFTVVAGAPSAAAQRLVQRNRLAEVAATLEEVERDAARASADLAEARDASLRAGESERAARQRVRDSITGLGRARDAQTALTQRAASTASRLGGLDEAAGRLRADLAESEEQHAAAAQGLAELPDAALGREHVAALRSQVGERRGEQATAQAEHDRLVREARERQQALAGIAAEEQSWQGRADAAAQRRESLAERRHTLEAEIARLAEIPAQLAAQRDGLADTIAAATARRDAAVEALAAGEQRLGEAEKALKAAEAELGASREDRVRCEASHEQAQEAQSLLLRRIAERLECEPHRILETAEIAADDELPSLADAAQRLERLTRERDNMGPVNLMAEGEAAELETRIAGMNNEREDLTAAIARLRQGISALNREGRERLVAAFAQVNEHFENLFVRLFGGGRAHLALDEGEDPLEAGLEIMASPPGKRLQNLSLLSGGEQALTALALLFAVFLTNPAPICVLDEVDAPLDDANVDRFCRLVEEIAESSATRFLIITHHRITMARMDRLYGVTMAERGISQLVSVDLQSAVRLRKTA